MERKLFVPYDGTMEAICLFLQKTILMKVQVMYCWQNFSNYSLHQLAVPLCISAQCFRIFILPDITRLLYFTETEIFLN